MSYPGEASNRFYFHRMGLFFDFRRAATDFKNEHFDNEDWHVKEWWFVFVRLNAKWIARNNLYYDGHTVWSVTLLGIELGWGYTYDSRPLAKWQDGK